MNIMSKYFYKLENRERTLNYLILKKEIKKIINIIK